MRWNRRRMLLMMFQGSNPIAASTTPTRIDKRISRNATASGEPPRKRCTPSWAAGKSRVSLGIKTLLRYPRQIISAEAKWGTGLMASMAARRCHGVICGFRLQHPFQRFQPVGLARRLVPAQPADARKPHRDAGFVPRRPRQSFERDLQDQPLVGLVHD